MLGHRRSRLLVLALFLAVLTGCVSTTFHPAKDYQPRQAPPLSPDRVAQFDSFPNEPFQTLGTVEAWVTGYHSQETVNLKVREAAAAIGADAVVATGPRLYAYAPAGDEMTHPKSRCIMVTVTAVRFPPSPPSR